MWDSLLEEFFEELGCIGDAVRAVAQRLAGADAFQQLALGGAVPLLEFLHHLLHPGAGQVAVLRSKTDDHPGADKGPAGSFHIPHAGPVGSGDVQCGLLRKANEVAVGADYRLGAVV